MRWVVAGLILAAMAFTAGAETHIGGNITKTSFERSGNPYIVDKDIIVPEGEEAVIREGCVFLFNAFTGLQVRGKLTVQGSSSAPVVFTSVNDNTVNPNSKQLANPFDWNGILVTRESGKALFREFAVRYGVFGIKSQSQNIVLQNGVFKSNGQFHFTLNDKIQYVQDDIPYSYGSPPPDLPGKDTSSAKPKVSSGKLVLRWSCLGVGVAGVTVGTIFGVIAGSDYSKLMDANDQLQRLRTTDPSVAGLSKTQRDYTAKYHAHLPACIILEVIGALGLAGFGLTYYF